MQCDSQQMGTPNKWTQRMMMAMPPTAAVDDSSKPVASAAQLSNSRNGLKCPRCESTNTKFCYFNNYSLSQPRHFCKACKRYWTRGGTLRNVPIGGGCRKNKRVKKKQQQQPLSSSATVKNILPVVTSCSVGFGNLGHNNIEGLINASLADELYQSPSLLNSDYVANFGLSQACMSLNSGLSKDVVKTEGDNNLMGCNNNSSSSVGTQWQANYPVIFESNAAIDVSPYSYWNSMVGGAAGWPDPANLSVAHLI